ncbi:MAG: hypothetical protein HY534_04385 [Chloroflexi bacterium]|nr:hypothetical protein [Chloroflexota bacterium]
MAEASPQTEASPARGRYWLRVYGYPGEIGEELIAYGDFYDPAVGPLLSDPKQLLHSGDAVVYYADGPASLFGAGVVDGEVEGPFFDGEKGQRWKVTVRAESVVRTVKKAAHAAGLTPPSGWHFLSAVRDYTFIRLPDEDGAYLVEQVKARASARDE